MRHRVVGVVVGVSLLAAAVVSALPAQAAYPGRDGKIAYVRERGTSHNIWTINPTAPAIGSSPSTAEAGIRGGHRTAG